VFKTRAIFGGIVFALDERFSIKISGSKEDRKNSYDRSSVSAGIIARF